MAINLHLSFYVLTKKGEIGSAQFLEGKLQLHPRDQQFLLKNFFRLPLIHKNRQKKKGSQRPNELRKRK